MFTHIGDIFFYDYPFSTPTKNAVNKRIIERPIFFQHRRDKQLLQRSKIILHKRDDRPFLPSVSETF